MTRAATPEVTVVIPTRDRRPLLTAHALPSALGQEGVELEVVVVDDASQDGTVEHLRSLGDERVRVVRHERPRRAAAARNSGIRAARGRWIALLDDDDAWAPSKLRRQLAAADGADARWAYAGAVVFSTDAPTYALPLPAAAEIAAALERGNVVPGGTSNVLVQTALVREAGLFDETLPFCDDWDMWLRLARGACPAVVDDVLVATFAHPDRSFYRYRPEIAAEIERMLAKHRPVTREDRLTIAQWLADQHHRGGDRLRAAATYLKAAVAYRAPGNLPAAAGALFGRRGIALASRLLVATRGVSHLVDDAPAVIADPLWLAPYRAGAGGT